MRPSTNQSFSTWFQHGRAAAAGEAPTARPARTRTRSARSARMPRLVFARVVVMRSGDPRAALAFLGCLAGLTVWCAASVTWSAEPGTSWQFANRVLAYLAFACAGVVAGGWLRDAPRAAAGALAALIGAVFVWALAAKAI